MRHLWLATLCTALFGLMAAPAQGAFDDPLFVFTPEPKSEPGKPPQLLPPPTGFLNGPCGLAVDITGHVYVSDYYHRTIDIFAPSESSGLAYVTQLKDVDALNGSCALALDASNNLYANVYHQSVAKFGAAPLFTPGALFDVSEPTGVTLNPAGGTVYVNERTQISAFTSAGVPILNEGEPLRIGVGSLTNAYGLAISRFGGSPGYLYVVDAGGDEVKVYDPAGSPDLPLQTISGPPDRDFISLRDSALAVDWQNGYVYVTEDTQPTHTERPEAMIHVFDAAGGYEGHLKYNIVTARPSGLTVDNSGGFGQGRVYVTSGNTSPASVIAYPPGAATKASPLPPLGAGSGGGGGSSATAAAPVAHEAKASQAGEAQASGAAPSVISQKGNLRVKVSGRLAPRRLPRQGTAPISISVAGQITTTDQSLPPQLKSLRIELNRHGRLDDEGLPVCEYERIQPGSSSRALAACRSALVGRGSFTANITLAGQEPYPTRGKLLVFNGRQGGRQVLYGHIYSAHPFATSFVIVFGVSEKRKGTYGTVLDAPLPKAMDAWGRLTGLQMTLARSYRHKGKRHSFISSGCPAPKGFGLISFPLARTAFEFTDRRELRSTVVGSCRVGG